MLFLDLTNWNPEKVWETRAILKQSFHLDRNR